MTDQELRRYEYGRDGQRSVGELVEALVDDLQQLVRQEVQLAKTELAEEAGKTAKAAAALSAAGFGAAMVAVFLSLAAALGLAEVMPGGWAALIVAGAWALLAAMFAITGRALMRRVSPLPRRTIESVRETARWARHPTS